MSMNFFFAKSLSDKNAAPVKTLPLNRSEGADKAARSQALSTPSSQSWGTQEQLRPDPHDAFRSQNSELRRDPRPEPPKPVRAPLIDQQEAHFSATQHIRSKLAGAHHSLSLA